MNFGYKKIIEKRSQLTSMKKRLSTKALVNTFKFFIYSVLVVVVVFGFFVIGMAKGIIDNAPDIDDISIAPANHSTTIYNSKGKEITKLVTSGSNRVSVTLDEIPEHLQWAFVCTEDERFYTHNGIDLKGITRAVYVALTTRSLKEGASTITQQLLKNSVFTGWETKSTAGNSFKRKLQEQYLALQLEKQYSKDNILENYLNTINLGSNTLGVQMASQRYFGKDVTDLTISESAVIAGITQNPSEFDPIRFPESNSTRRAKILKNMRDQEKITEAEYLEALEDDVYTRIKVIDSEIGESSPYTYFIDELIDQALNDLMTFKGYTYAQAHNALYSGGLKIYTTQDSQIQSICDKEFSDDANFPVSTKWSFDWAWSVQHKNGEVENYSQNSISYYYRNTLGETAFKLIFNTQEEAAECVKAYKKAMKKKGDTILGETPINYTIQPQGSISVIDQSTGHVKAIVGGRGKKTSSLTLNRATDTTRQPGSTIKPIAVYAPAIDTKGYTLNTTVVDEPYAYSNGRSVSNWYKGYWGTQSVRYAIEQSMNIIAVKVLTDITPEVGYEYLEDFGISTLVPEDLIQAMALGGLTKGVTNLEMTAAYATIANMGIYTKPIFYTKIVDHNGRVLIDNTTPSTSVVIKPTTAYYLTQALEDVVKQGTGTAAAVKDMHVAGKTGTTSSEYDLWFVGFTPYLTASIWTGYDENTGLGNGSWHSALWSKIMTQICQKKKYKDTNFKTPDSFNTVTLCSQSKLLANEHCSVTYDLAFPEDSVPTKKCYHGTEPLDDDSSSDSDNDSKDKKKDDNKDSKDKKKEDD